MVDWKEIIKEDDGFKFFELYTQWKKVRDTQREVIRYVTVLLIAFSAIILLVYWNGVTLDISNWREVAVGPMYLIFGLVALRYVLVEMAKQEMEEVFSDVDIDDFNRLLSKHSVSKPCNSDIFQRVGSDVVKDVRMNKCMRVKTVGTNGELYRVISYTLNPISGMHKYTHIELR